MQPAIFISRDTNRSRNFIEIVQSNGGNITCASLIDFKMVHGGTLPKDGWLFFYSQTGVDFFLKQFAIIGLESKGLKIGAFGPKTGQYMRERGFYLDFIGTGEAETTANLFNQEDRLTKVCFVLGTTSKDSLAPLLGPNTDTDSLIVYDNTGKQSIDIPDSDILVFTSPLNLETYYNHYTVSPKQKTVVIGTSTAMSALYKGLEEVHISSRPSLESLGALVVELVKLGVVLRS